MRSEGGKQYEDGASAEAGGKQSGVHEERSGGDSGGEHDSARGRGAASHRPQRVREVHISAPGDALLLAFFRFSPCALNPPSHLLTFAQLMSLIINVHVHSKF